MVQSARLELNQAYVPQTMSVETRTLSYVPQTLSVWRLAFCHFRLRNQNNRTLLSRYAWSNQACIAGHCHWKLALCHYRLQPISTACALLGAH